MVRNHELCFKHPQALMVWYPKKNMLECLSGKGVNMLIVSIAVPRFPEKMEIYLARLFLF